MAGHKRDPAFSAITFCSLIILILGNKFVLTRALTANNGFVISTLKLNNNKEQRQSYIEEKSFIHPQQSLDNSSGAAVFDLIPWEKLRQVGCYNIWTQKDSGTENQFRFLDDPQRCLSDCLAASGYDNEIALMQGRLCICSKWENFKRTQIREEYCDIECPEPGGSEGGQLRCGGNLAMSVFCRDGDASCIEPSSGEEAIPGYSLGVLENPEFLDCFQGTRKCFRCDGDDCGERSGREEVDYFPRLSPAACVLNCRRLGTETETYLSARLFWMDVDGENTLPICACKEDYPGTDSYKEVPQELCSKSCPGAPDETCGAGLNYFSAYSTVNETCSFYGEDPEQTPGESTATSESTTSTTEEDSTSTAQQSSSSSSSSAFPSSSSSTEQLISSTSSTELVMTSTPERLFTSTEQQATTTLSPPLSPNPCTQKCVGSYEGVSWEVCPGQTGSKPCRGEATGQATWHCFSNGTFETSLPDFSACRMEWYDELWDRFNETLTNNNQTIPEEEAKQLLVRMEEHCLPSNDLPYYGHEIKDIAEFIRQIVSSSNVTNDASLVTILNRAMDLSGLLLSNPKPWQDLEDSAARSNVGNAYVKSLEETVLTLSKLIDSEGYTAKFTSNHLDKSKFFVHYGTGSKGLSEDLKFPKEAAADSSFILLDKGWESLVTSTKADYVGHSLDSALYKNIFPASLTSLPDGTKVEHGTKTLNGPLLSLTIKGLPASPRDPAGSSAQSNLKGKKVRITFQHDVEAWGDEARTFRRKLHHNETRKVAMGSALCVFWSVKKQMWSPEGCRRVKVTPTWTECECDHLTSFAVLMDYHHYVGKDFGLEVLTFILCPLTVICLIVSVVIFSTVEAIQSQRTTITKHLSICLLTGTVLLLLFLDRSYFNMPVGVCTAVGIVTHYVYLAAFMWMWIEGMHLYRMVVHVFDAGKSRTTIYRIIAYGVPLLIVGVTCVVGFLLEHHPYGGEMYCWLEGQYIWSFIVPVAVVVVSNFIILIVALKTAYQMRTSTATLQARQLSYKTWIRGSFSITILLGLTWLPGFFMIGNPTIVGNIAAYIFVLLNGSQGIFVFIFHCYRNEKVRAAAGRNIRLPSWLSTTPQASREVTQTGHRADNMRALYFSEVSKSLKDERNRDFWTYEQAEPERVISRSQLVQKALAKKSSSRGATDSSSLASDASHDDHDPPRVWKDSSSAHHLSSDSGLSDDSHSYLFRDKGV